MSTRKYYIVVTPFFPSQKEPFRCNFVFDQVKAIQRLSGLTPIVFSPDYPLNRSTDFRGIRVEGIKVKAFPSFLFNGFFNRANARNFLRRLNDLAISPHDIFAVHAHTTQYASMALGIKNLDSEIKTILQHHDLDPMMILHGRFSSLWPNLRYRAYKSRQVIERIDLNLCVSRASLEHLLRFPDAHSSDPYPPYRRRERSFALKGFRSPRPHNAVAIINGVDSRKFSPIISSADTEFFTIGIIANYNDVKRRSVLIHAIALLRNRGYNNIRLKSVGTEFMGYRDAFIKEAATLRLSDSIELIDSINHDNLRQFYASINLFVMPSVFEGFGCVYAESAACGVPFIGIQSQGVADIVSPSQSHLWLARPDDYIDLADKIEQQILSPQSFTPSQPLDIDYHVNSLLTILNRHS